MIPSGKAWPLQVPEQDGKLCRVRDKEDEVWVRVKALVGLAGVRLREGTCQCE